MAFRVSPGVNFSEIDATQRVAPVATSDAAIAAGFQWGPADIVTTVTGESDLAEVFGEPDADTAVNWLTAASFLAYSNSLQVIRTVDSTAKNAVSDIGTTEGVVTDIQLLAGGTGYTAGGAESTTVSPAGGTGLTVATTVVSNVITAISVTAGGSGYEPGQTITVSGAGSNGTATIEAVSAGGGVTSVLVENEGDFDDAIASSKHTSTAAFVARYAGPLGNSLRVSIYHDGTFANWAEDFIVNGVTTPVDYSGLFDRAPGTSNHVLTRNGNTSINDEVHLVVVDADGKFSNTPGKVLERYAHLSLVQDSKDEQGNSNYILDVIRQNSKYIYATGQWNEVTVDFDGSTATNWEDKASTSTTVFNTLGTPYSVDLSGGVVDNSSSGSGSNSAGVRYDSGNGKGYAILRDTEQTDVSIIIAGEATNALQINLIDNVAEYRKDAVVTISPSTDAAKAAIIGTGIQTTKASAVTDWLGSSGINKSSSYAIADSGYKRMYDRYSDTYRSIPLNGDIAGLIAQTEATRDAWFSPAGFQRGNIKNAVKLYFNPDQNSRDKIYKAGANPVVSFPGQGTLLYGDKTLYQKPSAFDRINVRRLFIVLEKAVSRAAKQMLFEFNDEFTRSAFRGMVNPFLRDIQGRRGITDFLVVCDTTNNTADVIDRNEFVGDIYIKPSRSINFIQLNFVAVRSGVAFNEVAGIA
tara:strand:+ start:105 stop:2186 length:2082 start_codon:yes stop_codon:yes gene_type:complete